jgi:hypothetical protein
MKRKIDTPATIYDIDAIRVDRSVLTIRDAATVLNRELTAPVVARLVRRAIGDQADQFPLRALAEVYKRILPQIFEPDEALRARVEGLVPDVSQITLGEYHQFLDASEQKIAFPPVAITLLQKAYGEDIVNEPYAAAALLLKKIFDTVGAEGNE